MSWYYWAIGLCIWAVYAWALLWETGSEGTEGETASGQGRVADTRTGDTRGAAGLCARVKTCGETGEPN